ncbi:Small-subunit processome Utp12 [Penicillium cf. griseofulvum]|uniref:Small-subunit processome Utp12 n=1 Tax=Penicillium cf. griseofulvum TaxID=2972120 RepID=A0A9W9LX56_9EURO|nr:Small-subunit processome Utp12 [Penicillium cf. griseofulvum]
MKTDFKFSNLLGTVYRKGNLLFTPDGTCLLSPVGNRVSVFDLVQNTSYTLPFSHRTNIDRLDLSPKGNLLLTVDENGRAILTNFHRRIAIHHFSFKGRVSALKFSPSGRHFAVGVGRRLQIWQTPSTPGTETNGEIEFAPFVLHRDLAAHFDNIESVEWSSDSRFLLTAAKDLTARVWSMDPEEGFEPTTLAGHRQGVVAAYFNATQEVIYTVSQDGALFRWEYVTKKDEETMEDISDARWRIVKKDFFMQNDAKVNCAAFHAPTNLLVVGFSNGLFGLYDLPEFNMIHQLSVSQSNIDVVTINKSGEWLAFGSSKHGQLLVWEWQSESYILKQQGHLDSMNALAYSPDGQRIVTAADDGKIKVWDVKSGFCIVTFTEHTSGVTACQFAKKGNVLFTASLDGSVRAWDLIRYRNFRTFTAPSRQSFSSLAVDPSGEVICAGSPDSFDIHVWSVQTGQLLDQLSGHEGPVSSLAFAADGNHLVSGSWDHTVRIWSIFGRSQTSEPLQLMSDILSVAFRPDGQQVAASTLDGQLSFWSVEDAVQQGGVDGRRDVSGGRRVSERRTAANAAGTKSFNRITYSADGSCILAGGNSKYICLYDVGTGSLIKKFTVSVNTSIDGTQEILNSRDMTEAGPRALIDETGEASDHDDRVDSTLPGARRGDAGARTTRPEVRVTSVDFAPTGRAFCAASTEGLLVYSLDTDFIFDPYDLDITITPSSILATLDAAKEAATSNTVDEENTFLKALIMAFRLNEQKLLRVVYEAIPPSDIPHVVRSVPSVYLPRLLRFVAHAAEETPHLEFNLMWIESLFSSHGRYFKDNTGTFATELRAVQRAVDDIRENLKRLTEKNLYDLNYLLSKPILGDKKTSSALLAMETEDVEVDDQMVDADEEEAQVVPGIIDELRAAFDATLPGCEDTWIRIKPGEMFTRLIALSTSRMMAGDILRKNEEWLKVASNYAVNVGITILLLRPVPKFLRPIVAPFLPSVRKMKKQLRFAKNLFIPMIHERRLEQQAKDPNYTKPNDFLQWMMDLGEEKNENLGPDTLAHHMLLLVTLAVTHTSTMALCHCLYDLVTRPEYLEPLREEMSRTLPDGWYKATQASLRDQSRLDSFLRESQRFAPPGELNFHRIVKEPITLHDGLVLPVETHICFAAGPISKDDAFLKNPIAFDGFRWCHNPQDRFVLTPELAGPAMSNGAGEKMQAKKPISSAHFVSITNSNMHFGFGVQACPGRFFAANTLKAILSRLILDYEFKFVKDLGGKRPANLVVGEHILPSMSTEMLFRKRPIEL